MYIQFNANSLILQIINCIYMTHAQFLHRYNKCFTGLLNKFWLKWIFYTMKLTVEHEFLIKKCKSTHFFWALKIYYADNQRRYRANKVNNFNLSKWLTKSRFCLCDRIFNLKYFVQRSDRLSSLWQYECSLWHIYSFFIMLLSKRLYMLYKLGL